jgi:hypothetical protein
MDIAAHLSDRPKAAAAFALLSAAIALVIPATARADIFKWTDEQGKVNISNVPPPAAAKAKDVELVLKESRPAALAQHLATPTEQALLARIEGLEHQLQSRQYMTQPPVAPAPSPYAAYSPPAPPPPPSMDYYNGPYPGSYPAYYPSYSYPIASSYVVYPARTYATRPAFAAPRGGFSHTGGGHGGHRGRR